MAAGAGTRFGGGKLLAPWRGEPLVRAAARIALAAPVDLCIAVTGCDAERVEAALAPVRGDRLILARCPDWGDGLSASLRCGLRALPRTSRGVVVFLADMPLVPPGAAAPLLDALERGAIAAEYRRGGQPAHPVAFARDLYPELALLRGDQGGRALLPGRAGVARLTTGEPGAVLDIDRRSDLDAPARSEPRRLAMMRDRSLARATPSGEQEGVEPP
nr:nucleotidyltransferase family protein [Rubellimicrobium aerolatum]